MTWGTITKEASSQHLSDKTNVGRNSQCTLTAGSFLVEILNMGVGMANARFLFYLRKTITCSYVTAQGGKSNACIDHLY